MSYPATIEVHTPEQMARWRPLVQWFLAIPHFFIARALEYVASALAIVSWFVVLFTKRLPQGIANLQVMILRYEARTHTYAGFLHDEYPPFAFDTTSDEPGGTPVDLRVDPDLGERNRVSVAFRILLIIPALLFTLLVAIVSLLAWLVAAFAVLFTGRWPEGLRRWAMGLMRLGLRFRAYALLLTDEYPPFRIS